MKPESCVINPKTGVGPILLGAPISGIENEHGFKKVFDPNLDDAAWFDCEECDITIHPDENGQVQSIHLDKFAILFGVNLVGLDVDEALRVVGQAPSEWEQPYASSDGREFDIANFDSLGLSLWFNRQTVVAVVVDNGEYDD